MNVCRVRQSADSRRAFMGPTDNNEKGPPRQFVGAALSFAHQTVHGADAGSLLFLAGFRIVSSSGAGFQPAVLTAKGKRS